MDTMSTYLLSGAAIPDAVRALVHQECRTLTTHASVLALFDAAHALCGPDRGCHLAVAMGDRVYRTGSIYTQFKDGRISCEGNHCSMSQRARDHYLRCHLPRPRYATSGGGVGGPVDEGPHPGCFHRDSRGTFATVSAPGGIRVQTSTGYSKWLPPGSHKPCVTRVRFARFIHAEVGDALVKDRFRSADTIVWDHAVLGSSPGHTFHITRPLV